MAWLTVIVYVAGIGTTHLLERATGLRKVTTLEDAVLLTGFGAFALVGTLLVAKRPSNLVSWILAAVALMVGSSPPGTPTPPT